MITANQQPGAYGPEDFVVVAAVDDHEILDACLARSPDIRSGALPLLTIEGAPSMTVAYNRALAQSDRRIFLFAHQDVYLPEGWLRLAVERLNALTAMHPDWLVAGPYGVRPDRRHVGRVWDVTLGRELGGPGFSPTAVESFDELLLILRRDEPFRFDEALPHFHLYGTDLAQTALAAGRTAWAVELPVVHNNRPIASLRGGYERAYRYTRRKWRDRLPIETTMCALSWNPFALWRTQFRRRHVRRRPDKLLADAADVARAAGYE